MWVSSLHRETAATRCSVAGTSHTPPEPDRHREDNQAKTPEGRHGIMGKNRASVLDPAHKKHVNEAREDQGSCMGCHRWTEHLICRSVGGKQGHRTHGPQLLPKPGPEKRLPRASWTSAVLTPLTAGCPPGGFSNTQRSHGSHKWLTG